MIFLVHLAKEEILLEDLKHAAWTEGLELKTMEYQERNKALQLKLNWGRKN